MCEWEGLDCEGALPAPEGGQGGWRYGGNHRPDVFHWSPNSIAGGLDADLASVSSGGSSCESSLEVPALVMMNHSVQQRQLCVQYSSILTSLSHKLCRVQARNSSQLQVLRDPQSMSTFIDVLERASLLLIEQFQSVGV